eukprot:XP_014018873.1 PREDICTED: olfactory receptor 10A6-like [Salmo salar]
MTNSMANVSQPLEFNVSLFSDFLIHGGELGLKEIYTDLAIFLLVVYIMVVIGNAMIITLVLLDSKLHTPMLLLADVYLFDIPNCRGISPMCYGLRPLCCYLQSFTLQQHHDIQSMCDPGLNSMGFGDNSSSIECHSCITTTFL